VVKQVTAPKAHKSYTCNITLQQFAHPACVLVVEAGSSCAWRRACFVQAYLDFAVKRTGGDRGQTWMFPASTSTKCTREYFAALTWNCLLETALVVTPELENGAEYR